MHYFGDSILHGLLFQLKPMKKKAVSIKFRFEKLLLMICLQSLAIIVMF